MEKKILKKRQSASQETKELSEQGAEKSNSGLITAGMLLYSKTELSEARGRLFLVESVDADCENRRKQTVQAISGTAGGTVHLFP